MEIRQGCGRGMIRHEPVRGAAGETSGGQCRPPRPMAKLLKAYHQICEPPHLQGTWTSFPVGLGSLPPLSLPVSRCHLSAPSRALPRPSPGDPHHLHCHFGLALSGRRRRAHQQDAMPPIGRAQEQCKISGQVEKEKIPRTSHTTPFPSPSPPIHRLSSSLSLSFPVRSVSLIILLLHLCFEAHYILYTRYHDEQETPAVTTALHSLAPRPPGRVHSFTQWGIRVSRTLRIQGTDSRANSRSTRLRKQFLNLETSASAFGSASLDLAILPASHQPG
jgi:hypothetical protein